MKSILTFLYFLFLSEIIFSQGFTTLETMGMAGAEANSSSISISWTIGEELIETYASSNIKLTQGYQQQLYNLKAKAGPNQTINNGTITTLNGHVNGGSGYYTFYWIPGNKLNDSTILNPTTVILSTSVVFSLHVKDQKNNCKHADQMSIFVAGGPLGVNTFANPDTVCAGLPVQLNSLPTGGSGNYTFSWTSIPAGFTSNLQNPVCTPAITTTYIVNVFDGFTNMNQQLTVKVNPSPALFSVSGGGNYCEGGSGVEVGLNGSELGITYELLLNGLSTGKSLMGTGGNINFGLQTEEGKYTITATNGTCKNTMHENAFISLIHLPTASAGPNDTICSNDIYAITRAQVSDFSSLFWSSSGSGYFVNNGTLNPVYYPSIADYNTGSVNLTLSANSISPCTGNVSSSLSLYFKDLPSSNAGNDHLICSNEAYNINDATAINYSSLNWNTTGTGIFNNPKILNSVYLPSSNDISKGSVVLSLTTTGYGGCGKASDQMILSFKPAPAADFKADDVCDGNPVAFTNTSAGSGNLNYAWTFDDGTIGTETNPSHLYPSNGIYSPKLVATTENNCSDTASYTLTIKQQSVSDFSVLSPNIYIGDSVYFLNSSSNYTICGWNFGDGDTASINNPVHYYKLAGDYEVILFTNNAVNCPGSKSDSIKVSMHAPNDFDINLFPNPAWDVFTIQFYLDEDANVQIQLFDQASRMSRSLDFSGCKKGMQKLFVDIRDLRDGAYIVAVYINNLSMNQGSFNSGTLENKKLRYESYGKVVKMKRE